MASSISSRSSSKTITAFSSQFSGSSRAWSSPISMRPGESRVSYISRTARDATGGGGGSGSGSGSSAPKPKDLLKKVSNGFDIENFVKENPQFKQFLTKDGKAISEPSKKFLESIKTNKPVVVTAPKPALTTVLTANPSSGEPQKVTPYTKKISDYTQSLAAQQSGIVKGLESAQQQYTITMLPLRKKASNLLKEIEAGERDVSKLAGQFQSDADKLNTNANSLESQYNALKNKKNLTQSDVDNFNKKVSSLQSTISEFNKTWDIKEKDGTMISNVLQSKLDNIQENLQQRNSVIADYDRNVSRLQQFAKNSEGQSTAIGKKLKDTQKEIEELQKFKLRNLPDVAFEGAKSGVALGAAFGGVVGSLPGAFSGALTGALAGAGAAVVGKGVELGTETIIKKYLPETKLLKAPKKTELGINKPLPKDDQVYRLFKKYAPSVAGGVAELATFIGAERVLAKGLTKANKALFIKEKTASYKQFGYSQAEANKLAQSDLDNLVKIRVTESKIKALTKNKDTIAKVTQKGLIEKGTITDYGIKWSPSTFKAEARLKLKELELKVPKGKVRLEPFGSKTSEIIERSLEALKPTGKKIPIVTKGGVEYKPVKTIVERAGLKPIQMVGIVKTRITEGSKYFAPKIKDGKAIVERTKLGKMREFVENYGIKEAKPIVSKGAYAKVGVITPVDVTKVIKSPKIFTAKELLTYTPSISKEIVKKDGIWTFKKPVKEESIQVSNIIEKYFKTPKELKAKGRAVSAETRLGTLDVRTPWFKTEIVATKPLPESFKPRVIKKIKKTKVKEPKYTVSYDKTFKPVKEPKYTKTKGLKLEYNTNKGLLDRALPELTTTTLKDVGKGVRKLKIKPTIKITKPITKTKTISLSYSEPKPITKIRQDIFSDIKSKQNKALDELQSSLQKTSITQLKTPKVERITDVTQRSDIGLATKSTQLLVQKEISKQKPDLRVTRITIVPDFDIKIPKPKKIMFPDAELEPITTKDLDKMTGGFNVEVKSKGKFIKVNRKVLDFKSAMGLLIESTDNTVAVSGKINKVKRKGGSLKNISSNLTNINKYGRSKNNPNIFVERERFRIDTQGEVNGISAKGWISERNKPKKRGRKPNKYTSLKLPKVKL